MLRSRVALALLLLGGMIAGIPSCTTVDEPLSTLSDDVDGGVGPTRCEGGECGDHCAVPNDGCDCDKPGETIDCGHVAAKSGDYVSCSVGLRTCGKNKKWGECEGRQIIEVPLKQGTKQTKGLANGPSICINNPCDPNCKIFTDTPDGGFDAGDSSIVFGDAGITNPPGPPQIPDASALDVHVSPEGAPFDAGPGGAIDNQDPKDSGTGGAGGGDPTGGSSGTTGAGTIGNGGGGGDPTGGGVGSSGATNSGTGGSGVALAGGAGDAGASASGASGAAGVVGYSGGTPPTSLDIDQNVPPEVKISGGAPAGVITIDNISSAGVPHQVPAPFDADALLQPGNINSPAIWEMDSSDTAALNPLNGQISVYYPVARTLTLKAKVGAFTQTAPVKVVVNATECTGLTAAQCAAYFTTFGGAVTGTDAFFTMYPYDQTVFPRHITPPVVQWQPGASSACASVNADAVKITLRYLNAGAGIDFTWAVIRPELFDFDPGAGVNNKAGLPLENRVWWPLDQTASGQTAQIKIQRVTCGVLRPEKIINIKFSTEPLLGTIYYWEINNGKVAKIDAQTGARTGNYLQSTAKAWSPGVGTRCVACHSVSANGNRIAVQFDGGYGPGGVFDATNGAQLYERPSSPVACDSNGDGFVTAADAPCVSDWSHRVNWQALSPDGSYTMYGDHGAIAPTLSDPAPTDSIEAAMNREFPTQIGRAANQWDTGPFVMNGAFSPGGTKVIFAHRNAGWGAWTGWKYGWWYQWTFGNWPGPSEWNDATCCGVANPFNIPAGLPGSWAGAWKYGYWAPDWWGNWHRPGGGAGTNLWYGNVWWDTGGSHLGLFGGFPAGAWAHVAPLWGTAFNWTNVNTWSMLNRGVADVWGYSYGQGFSGSPGPVPTVGNPNGDLNGWGWLGSPYQDYGYSHAPYQAPFAAGHVDAACPVGSTSCWQWHWANATTVGGYPSVANNVFGYGLNTGAGGGIGNSLYAGSGNQPSWTFFASGAPWNFVPYENPPPFTEVNAFGGLEGNGWYVDYKSSVLWSADFKTSGTCAAGVNAPCFQNVRQVARNDWDLPVATYPTFAPDNQTFVYQKADRVRTRNHVGELWLSQDKANYLAADFAPIRMTQANGVVTPGHLTTGLDQYSNYEPTFNPEDSGGYNWLVFISNRGYGNLLPTTGACWPQNCGVKQMWVTAVDPTITAGADPSHPAFWLPGQQLTNQNMRGFWAKSPCKASPSACTVNEECCGYTANPATSTAQCQIVTTSPLVRQCMPIPVGATCSPTGGACNQGSDCCNYTSSPQDLCVNTAGTNKCTTVIPPSQTYKDYSTTCGAYDPVDWNNFAYNVTIPGTSHVEFWAQTASTPAGLAAATAVQLGSISTTSSGNIDIGAKLTAGGVLPDRYVRVTTQLFPDVALVPTVNSSSANFACLGHYDTSTDYASSCGAANPITWGNLTYTITSVNTPAPGARVEFWVQTASTLAGLTAATSTLAKVETLVTPGAGGIGISSSVDIGAVLSGASIAPQKYVRVTIRRFLTQALNYATVTASNLVYSCIAHYDEVDSYVDYSSSCGSSNPIDWKNLSYDVTIPGAPNTGAKVEYWAQTANTLAGLPGAAMTLLKTVTTSGTGTVNVGAKLASVPITPGKYVRITTKRFPSTGNSPTAQAIATENTVATLGYACDPHFDEMDSYVDYLSACASTNPLDWGDFGYDATTPGDSKVEYWVQTAATQAGLAAATSVKIKTVSGFPGGKTGTVDIGAALDAAGIAHEKYLRVTTKRFPTSDGLAIATVGTPTVDYDCLPHYDITSYDKDFQSACLSTEGVAWGTMQWSAVTPGDSKIEIRVSTAATSAGLGAATPVLLATLSGASPATSGDVAAALDLAGIPHEAYLRVTVKLFPTSDGTKLPTLTNIVQSYDCAPFPIPTGFSPTEFHRDYVGSCPGQSVAWHYFDRQTTTPGDSKIELYVQSAKTSAGLASATPVLFAIASGAPGGGPGPDGVGGTADDFWVSTDVGAALDAASIAQSTYLRITFKLFPSSSGAQAPTLVRWRQSFTCVDSQ